MGEKFIRISFFIMGVYGVAAIHDQFCRYWVDFQVSIGHILLIVFAVLTSNIGFIGFIKKTFSLTLLVLNLIKTGKTINLDFD